MTLTPAAKRLAVGVPLPVLKAKVCCVRDFENPTFCITVEALNNCDTTAISRHMSGILPIGRQTQDKQSINQSTQSVLLCLMVAFGYSFFIINSFKLIENVCCCNLGLYKQCIFAHYPYPCNFIPANEYTDSFMKLLLSILFFFFAHHLFSW